MQGSIEAPGALTAANDDAGRACMSYLFVRLLEARLDGYRQALAASEVSVGPPIEARRAEIYGMLGPDQIGEFIRAWLAGHGQKSREGDDGQS